jgi:hypothetical protein
MQGMCPCELYLNSQAMSQSLERLGVSNTDRQRVIFALPNLHSFEPVDAEDFWDFSDHRFEDLPKDEEEDNMNIPTMAPLVANIPLNARHCKHSFAGCCMSCITKAYYGDSLSCWPWRRSGYMDRFRYSRPPSMFSGIQAWMNPGRRPLQLNFCAHQPRLMMDPRQGSGWLEDLRHGPGADVHDPVRNHLGNFFVDNINQVSKRIDRLERNLEERFGTFLKELERLDVKRVDDMRRRLFRDFAS